jgi:hypothetical protein
MKQYEIWWAALPESAGRRPVLLSSRDGAYSYLNKFPAVEISSTVRHISVEVPLGPDPAIQAALGRLAKPAAAGGWVASRAQEMSKDHQMWLVNQQPPGGNQAAVALRAVHQFSLGLRVTGEVGLDGEVIADSDSGAEQISTWLERVKARLRKKNGQGSA